MMDELLEDRVIKDEVFAQVGHSDYVPRNYESEDFLSKDDFDSSIKTCDLLITHSGIATIIAGLKHHKPTIVVPRLSKFGEHVDDHQVQIADSFSAQNFVFACNENDSLLELIEKARTHTFAKYISGHNHAIETIQAFLATI